MLIMSSPTINGVVFSFLRNLGFINGFFALYGLCLVFGLFSILAIWLWAYEGLNEAFDENLAREALTFRAPWWNYDIVFELAQ